jgi:predicted transcriptional regulator
MAKILDESIEKVSRLPEERQAYATEVSEQIAVAGDGVSPVPQEHRAAVLEGLGQAERGELVGDEEMAALWKRCGL